MDWLGEQKPDQCFVFSKVSPVEVESIALLESAGFNLVDTNVTFSKSLGDSFQQASTGEVVVEGAVQEDCEAVCKVAYDSFIYSRFHLDPHIANEVANVVKREWVRNYFKGKRGEHMVVARVKGEIAGFVQILERDRVFIIDLIAVGASFRGMGIARSMIAHCLNRYKDFSMARVGTQIANTASMNLYLKCGYKLESAKYIFHYHSR